MRRLQASDSKSTDALCNHNWSSVEVRTRRRLTSGTGSTVARRVASPIHAPIAWRKSVVGDERQDQFVHTSQVFGADRRHDHARTDRDEIRQQGRDADLLSIRGEGTPDLLEDLEAGLVDVRLRARRQDR